MHKQMIEDVSVDLQGDEDVSDDDRSESRNYDMGSRDVHEQMNDRSEENDNTSSLSNHQEIELSFEIHQV